MSTDPVCDGSSSAHHRTKISSMERARGARPYRLVRRPTTRVRGSAYTFLLFVLLMISSALMYYYFQKSQRLERELSRLQPQGPGNTPSEALDRATDTEPSGAQASSTATQIQRGVSAPSDGRMGGGTAQTNSGVPEKALEAAGRVASPDPKSGGRNALTSQPDTKNAPGLPGPDETVKKENTSKASEQSPTLQVGPAGLPQPPMMDRSRDAVVQPISFDPIGDPTAERTPASAVVERQTDTATARTDILEVTKTPEKSPERSGGASSRGTRDDAKADRASSPRKKSTPGKVGSVYDLSIDAQQEALGGRMSEETPPAATPVTIRLPKQNLFQSDHP